MTDEEAYGAVMGAVRKHFRPEFINRIDEIVVFHRLKREEMGRIVSIQLDRLRKLIVDRKIEIKLSAAAETWLANRGYDPVYGARPLKRVIQKNVQDPLAEMLLAGDLVDGTTVKVDVADGKLTFNGRPRLATAA
jgi:ATP-dependent Clp protease ATP-binding subunit ClpB